MNTFPEGCEVKIRVDYDEPWGVKEVNHQEGKWIKGLLVKETKRFVYVLVENYHELGETRHIEYVSKKIRQKNIIEMTSPCHGEPYWTDLIAWATLISE